MKQYVFTLQDLVQWGVVAGLVVLLLGAVFAGLYRRKLSHKLRKQKRTCAQCGILEKIAPEEPKFGTCPVCGGVTSRGRSRKLG